MAPLTVKQGSYFGTVPYQLNCVENVQDICSRSRQTSCEWQFVDVCVSQEV